MWQAITTLSSFRNQSIQPRHLQGRASVRSSKSNATNEKYEFVVRLMKDGRMSE